MSVPHQVPAHASSQDVRRRVAIVFVLANLLLVVLSSMTVTLLTGTGTLGFTLVGLLVGTMQVLYIRSSLSYLKESEIALVTLFGAPFYVVEKPGRFLMPAGCCSALLFDRNPISVPVLCPEVVCAPTSHTVEGGQDLTHDTGALPALDHDPIEDLLPAGTVMVSMRIDVTVQLEPERLPEFVTSLGSVAHMAAILGSLVRGVVTGLCGRSGIREVMGGAAHAFCENIARDCQSYFKTSGVRIAAVSIASVDFGKEVTAAMERVYEAEYRATMLVQRSRRQLERTQRRSRTNGSAEPEAET